MPGIFLALTILSGFSFAMALTWVVIQWVRADREAERAERELAERLGRLEKAMDRAGYRPAPTEATV